MIPIRPDGGVLDTPVALVIFNRPDSTKVVSREPSPCLSIRRSII
jgi:hypothetical protein